MTAAPSPAARQVGDGAATGVFNRAGRTGVFGGAAQGHMGVARGEQQHASDGMAGERARKQREHARTRRA